ncbi:hypothetical protein J2T09_000012 [Neorhizobium huautlense]|uniref:Sulfotransferase domain-containing protein n=1 Tax=Neorhizobium huautlense TaxID=67774 RepID=A0ABT9PLD2_9HYPH|nr:hypothetical protein [Neorhizobium huautlense]MDP9835271.1 hypothetical protein [Neorhizobium huautlense]
MRLLVYGMQSSGATAFTLFLAQQSGCLGLVDILNNYAAPRLDYGGDVVAKVVVTTAYPLPVHQERFRPDRTILFLRDPRSNFESLKRKHYRNHSGLIEEKFALIDRIFAERDQFDAVIHYEDFIARKPQILETVNALGWAIDESCYAFRRNHDDLAAALWNAVPDLFERFEFSYGNVQLAEVTSNIRVRNFSAEVEESVSSLSPRLLRHYQQRDRDSLPGSNAQDATPAGYGHEQHPAL